MIFELTILGSSSALPTSTKFPSAHVLNIHEHFFLIDCGEGTQIQLRKAKINFSRIHHIFISHLHGDHVFGLFGLLSSFHLLGRKKTLHIYAPPAMENILGFYRAQFTEECSYPIELHPVSRRLAQKIYEDGVSEVFAFPLKHRIPAFGFLFREKRRALNIKKEVIEKFNLSVNQIRAIKSGEDLCIEKGNPILNSQLTEPAYHPRSYAYCSDTAYYQKNIDLLSGVDLLYHEATFLEKEKQLAKITGHSTASQAATMAMKVNAGRLLIGHFSNRYKKNDDFLSESIAIFPNSLVAEELQTYTVPLTRVSHC